MAELNRRFNNAGEANKELHKGFIDWSSSVNTYGLQTSYAIIAANWAVHGNANKIMLNDWAGISVTIIIVLLVVNLMLTGLMALLLKNRCIYSDADKDRWGKEFDEAQGAGSPWPYTDSIQNLGDFRRSLNIWAPVLAGIMFIIGLSS